MNRTSPPCTLFFYRSYFPDINLASFTVQHIDGPDLLEDLRGVGKLHDCDEKRTLVSTLGAGRLFLLSLFTDERHELVVERRASG